MIGMDENGLGAMAAAAEFRSKEENSALAEPPALGFDLSDALHPDGDGSNFSVSHALAARELGVRGFR